MGFIVSWKPKPGIRATCKYKRGITHQGSQAFTYRQRVASKNVCQGTVEMPFVVFKFLDFKKKFNLWQHQRWRIRMGDCIFWL